MAPRASIEFVKAEEPITEPVTKFGGQPVWVEGAQWPISKAAGRPMHFICQVSLDPELFGFGHGKVAYLFMTDDEEDYVDETWEADGGENAVVIQPGDSPNVETQPLVEGPTLYRMVSMAGQDKLVPEPCEFAVRLELGEDPDFVPQGQLSEWFRSGDDRYDRYKEQLRDAPRNKIGGIPDFIQGDEFPGGEPWKLLIQIDAAEVPFWLNFGDAGVGYAFISEDGRRGKFLWQCS